MASSMEKEMKSLKDELAKANDQIRQMNDFILRDSVETKQILGQMMTAITQLQHNYQTVVTNSSSAHTPPIHSGSAGPVSPASHARAQGNSVQNGIRKIKAGNNASQHASTAELMDKTEQGNEDSQGAVGGLPRATGTAGVKNKEKHKRDQKPTVERANKQDQGTKSRPSVSIDSRNNLTTKEQAENEDTKLLLAHPKSNQTHEKIEKQGASGRLPEIIVDQDRVQPREQDLAQGQPETCDSADVSGVEEGAVGGQQDTPADVFETSGEFTTNMRFLAGFEEEYTEDELNAELQASDPTIPWTSIMHEQGIYSGVLQDGDTSSTHSREQNNQAAIYDRQGYYEFVFRVSKGDGGGSGSSSLGSNY